MANLTIVVDDELLKRARIRAVEEGTSVNEVCRKAIESFAAPPRSETVEDLLAGFDRISRRVKPDPDGEPLWPGREALYEQALRERGLIHDQPAPRKRRSAR
jgi:plasmid stability protein